MRSNLSMDNYVQRFLESNEFGLQLISATQDACSANAERVNEFLQELGLSFVRPLATRFLLANGKRIECSVAYIRGNRPDVTIMDEVQDA